MNVHVPGSVSDCVDCDVHISPPGIGALIPFLDKYWREQAITRGIGDMELQTNAPLAPLIRPDWRPKSGKPGTVLADLQRHVLDPFRTRYAICNAVYGAQALYHGDLAAALCTALNDWVVKEWLDKDERLRASIVLPWMDSALAVEEIERRARDERFVQVLFLAAGEVPFGRRSMWPIYAAAEKHGLPIGIHAGNAGRHPTTVTGWPSYHIEDAFAQAQTFQTQLVSIITEGVFQSFPKLKVVLMESGVSWLPFLYARSDKHWRGLRMECPWVNKPPSQLIKEHVRLTIQPLDAPEDADIVSEILESVGSDKMLLFASDYPHWHFEGLAALPKGISPELSRKICMDNALETYPRLARSA